MDFNRENKVIVGTLDKPEARAFIKFLESEILRHQDDIDKAKSLIGYVRKEVLEEGGLLSTQGRLPLGE